MKRRILFSMCADESEAAKMTEAGLNAERLGFDCVWVSDHISDLPPARSVFDAWTSLAYIGSKTNRIMLASGVTDTQRMHPAKMASTVATLDNLTNGRAILGIGAGEAMNVKPYGMPWGAARERVARLREYVQVVQSLWASTYERPVTFEGRYYRLERAHMSVGPVRRPHPPVYVGAFASTGMLRLVGELGDGWFPGAYFTPEGYRVKVKAIQNFALSAGREPAELDLIANIPVIFGEDRETHDRVKNAFRASLVKNRYMLKQIGADDAYDFLSKSLMYQLISATPDSMALLKKAAESLPITEEQLERGLDELLSLGSVDHCVELLSRFIDAGATHVRISNFLSSPKDIATFADKVIPVLRPG